MLSQGVLSGLPWISQHLCGPILLVPEKGIKHAERALSRRPAGWPQARFLLWSLLPGPL